MIQFLDFEVTKYDWLVVITDVVAKTETVIVNDPDRLSRYYEKHKNNIWCGYNIRGYDQWIFKGILCGFNPYDITQHIIVKKQNGATFSPLLNKINMTIFDAQNSYRSLKEIEGFLGHDIRETTVPFDIDRPLTPDELEQMIFYCKHDVRELIEVWAATKVDFDAHLDIIKTFKLPMSFMGKTKAQLTASVLECVKQNRDDEWDISFVPTIHLNKYAAVMNWFRNPTNYNDGQSLEMDVCGIPHKFGLGGIHGAPKTAIHRKGRLIHVDVTSFYPALMIEYDLLSRNVTKPELFVDIRDRRVALKKAGKKKEQAPYKIIINAMFGVSGDKYSAAYDPRRNHEVCINGQLLLLDLLEKLEGHCDVIQSNTDGIIIQIPDTDEAFDMIDDICWEWESRTKMGLGFDFVSEIWQGDVNNYVFRFDDGKLERKGAYVKELSPIDYDLPIVNKAIVERIANGTPVEETIYNCDDLIEFQKVVKISGKYAHGMHNGKILTDKTFRVFASLDWRDDSIYKVKSGGNPEKFANTPDSCFIDNSNIIGKKCLGNVDKTWYVNLAKKRLSEKFNIV